MTDVIQLKMAQQNEAETLQALEHLMNEFFSPTTGNVRKREIENQLEAFSNQKESWRLCVYFITHSENQYVYMYALTAIESIINRQWPGLDWESRCQLKGALWSYLTQTHASHNGRGPMFLRNKLVKLIVDIARHDWPHFCPDFFDNIIQFIQSEQGRLLGIVLLRTASEELAKPRDDLTSERCVELNKLMQSHTGPALQTLTTLLESLAAKQKEDPVVTKTPPPSPTHPSCTPRPLSFTETSTRPDTRETCRETLVTVQHILSWIPLNNVNTSLIRVLFHFASAMSHTQDDDDISVLALISLSEILYRKIIPPDCEELLLHLSEGAVQLLTHITCYTSEQFEALSYSFIEKLTELLELLVDVHFRRLETELSFSTVDFLSLLFRYTFQQTNINQFMLCLDVWTAFLKQLKPENIRKYSDAITALTNAILNKMQYQHNHIQLEELDNENEINTSEEETDFQQFRNQSVEVLVLLTQFDPLNIFNTVVSLWRLSCEIYLRLHTSVDPLTRKLNISTAEEKKCLHYTLIDFSSLTFILSRLSSCFIDEDDEYFCASVDIVQRFITELMTVALYTTQHCFCSLQTTCKKVSSDLSEIHSQLITCVESWCLWPKLRSSIVEGQAICEILRLVFPLLSPSLNMDAFLQETLSYNASCLMLRLSSIAPPNIFLTLQPVRELVPLINSRLSPKSANILRHALCNIAILPTVNSNNTIINESHRLSLLNELIGGLCHNITSIENNTLKPNDVKSVIEIVLPQLSQLVSQYKHHNTSVKRLLCIEIKPQIQRILNFYPRYAHHSDINDHILGLFLSVLDVLRQQLGAEFTRQAVQVFLDVVNTQDQFKVSGLDKLLQILQLIVEEPGAAFRTLLPSTISLCLQQALPVVNSNPSDFPDLTDSLFKLLHSILLHRWQYFYKSQVQLGYSPGASDCSVSSNEMESLLKPDEFIAILQAFGQALLQSDINTFKLSLNALENLNTKWKLYSKILFREQMLRQFLTVLFHTLVHKSHALLSDEILLAIYNMASVDFNAFHTEFLPHFLSTTDWLYPNQIEMLLRNFCREQDMPTLTQNISQFINDMRCFRLCNVSLSVNS